MLRNTNLLLDFVVPAKNRNCFEGAVPGTALPSLHLLGLRLNTSNSNAEERELRINAMTRGWLQFRGFWHSSSPAPLKRLSYIVNAYSTATSGSTALALKPTDTITIDRKVVGHLRSMLKGRATDWSGRHAKTLTHIEVLRSWRLPPIALELRVQRINWWQQLAREPGSNKRLITALFGKARCEKEPTVMADGSLFDIGKSMGKLFWDDVSSLRQIDEFRAAVQDITLTTLFSDTVVRDELCAIDASILRAQLFSSSIAPWGLESFIEAEAPY